MMDPYWVLIDVVGVVPPPQLDTAIAAYPIPGAADVLPPLNPGINNCPYYIPFATAVNARHFAGYIQGSCGLHCWISISNIHPPLYI